MAKFTIDIDIDYLGEDGNLDEAIQKELKDSILNILRKKCVDNLGESIIKTYEERINSWINEFLAGEIETKTFLYPVSGSYGKTEELTLRDILSRKIDSAFTVTVDENGNPCDSYNKRGTRLDVLTGKMAQQIADVKTKEFAKDIHSQIGTYVSTKVKNELIHNLSATMVASIDFNKIFKQEDPKC